MNDPDVLVYPDSDKIGVFTGSAPGAHEERTLSKFFPASADVSYWQEEEDSKIMTSIRETKDWNGRQYARNSSVQFDLAREAIRDRLEPEGNESILDVGCGDGRVTALLASRLPEGEVLGIDASRSMLERARERSTEVDNLRFRRLDALTMDFEDEFDRITSFAALHWIPDHAALLKRFAEALRPGGRTFLHFGAEGNVPNVLGATRSVIARDPWRKWFRDYSSPLTFHGEETYRKLVWSSPLTADRIDNLTFNVTHESVDDLFGWIRSSLPHLDEVPEEQKDAFTRQVVEEFLERINRSRGPIPVRMARLEVGLRNQPDLQRATGAPPR